MRRNTKIHSAPLFQSIARIVEMKGHFFFLYKTLKTSWGYGDNVIIYKNPLPEGH